MNNNIFQIIKFGSKFEFFNVLDEVEINTYNEYEQNLLQEAIANNKTDIAIELIKRGINLNHQDLDGLTSLHYSAVHNNIIIAKEILINNGNVNLRDNHGNNPMWTAVFNARGNYEIVKILLKYDSDITTENKHGKSPLDFAKQIKDKTLCDILINKP